jgi:hypothetical protein
MLTRKKVDRRAPIFCLENVVGAGLSFSAAVSGLPLRTTTGAQCAGSLSLK